MTESQNPSDESSDKEEVEDTARDVMPFRLIRRGEDTVGPDDDIQFADFSPVVLPSDAPEMEIASIPKGVSVPEPAPLKESEGELKSQPESEKNVPAEKTEKAAG